MCEVLLNMYLFVCILNFQHSILLQVITSEQKNSVRWELTGEGKEVVEKGSHEALIYYNIPPEGIKQEDLLVSVSVVNFCHTEKQLSSACS